MVKSKSATTKSVKSTKTKPAKTSTKPKDPTSISKKIHAFAKKPNLLAWVVSAVIIIAVAIVVIANIVNNSNSSLTVKDGTGDKMTTEYIAFNDSSFSLKIPTSFHTLSTDDIKKKYGSDAPEVVYTNADDTVNIAISPSDSTLPNDQIKTYLDTMKSILGMGGDIIDDSYATKDGHNIAAVRIITETEATKYYNHMIFFSQDGKLTIVTFNCKDNEREKWQPVGEFILNSLIFQK